MRESRLIKYVIDNQLENEDFSGKVLWYDVKEGRGIMVTEDVAHEVYFDRSVISDEYIPKRGDILEFNFNTNIKNFACAKNVRLI